MGDPGLHSKFIEMQQEDALNADNVRADRDVRNESVRLDRARLERQLSTATNSRHRRILTRALEFLGDGNSDRKTL